MGRERWRWFCKGRGAGGLPVPLPDGLLCVDANAKPVQDIAGRLADAVPCNGFDLAVVFLEFILQVLDGPGDLVKFILYNLQIFFPGFQKGDCPIKQSACFCVYTIA